MRAYGTFNSNLVQTEKDKEIEIDYSIDSLVLESKDKQEFYIDFDEGDYSKDSEELNFRLKSLGVTFSEHWEDLDRDRELDIEQDYELFNKCTLKKVNICIHTREENEEKIKDLQFKLTEIYLTIQDKKIVYNAEKVEVEIC